MLLRFILLSILLTILVRALARLWAGVVRGMQGPDAAARAPFGTRVPQRGVEMARDPICGTFVVPERAVSLAGPAGERMYFCSTECRDRYLADRTAARPAPAHGRTA